MGFDVVRIEIVFFILMVLIVGKMKNFAGGVGGEKIFPQNMSILFIFFAIGLRLLKKGIQVFRDRMWNKPINLFVFFLRRRFIST